MKENIEEDIKIAKKLLLHSESVLLDDESMAIEHILSDYKRVLKENEEWQRAYQEEKDTQFELVRENQKLKSENEELREEDLMSQRALDIFDKRPFREKYLKERRAEQPNLLYPDADEIYERYYKLKEENKTLKDLLERENKK